MMRAMDPAAIAALLEAVRDGRTDVPAALERLRELPFEAASEELAIDHHRALRTGLVEAVYGEGKTAAQIVAAMRAIADRDQPAIATRVSDELAEAVRAELPDVRYERVARMLRLGPDAPAREGEVSVVCAGTTDVPVAEEAALTLSAHGLTPGRVRDVGVAGVHRLLARRAELDAADVLVVVAGMEGALPSVVAGLVRRPVIAVPTSVGYGASLGGLTAMLAMLTSCAPGVTVVNVDNGFGAACAALRILSGRA